MNRKWLGIPYLIWSGLCLIPAAVWLAVWPRDQAAAMTGLPSLILRWGHALTWALLALAALLAGLAPKRSTAPARLVGLLALGVYGAFLITLLTNR